MNQKPTIFTSRQLGDCIPGRRSHKYENLTYLVLWLLVVAIGLIDTMRGRSVDGLPPFDLYVMLRLLKSFAPFFILFIVNNWVLLPRLLFRNRFPQYFIALAFLLALIWAWQYCSFMHHVEEMMRNNPPRPPHMHRPRSLIPFPLMIDATYTLFIVGINLAVALLFRMIDDRIEREKLMKENAEGQLNYLKAQINPHFYMNMLNNIHGLIEIDAEAAQELVLGMSRLMRYMLYDSSKPYISLAAEIDFLSEYLNVMRRRYPESRVRISADFPPADDCRDIRIPPLLFLVFIENAFKHGISYARPSYVDVTIRLQEDSIFFSCENSIAPSSDARRPSADTSHHGVGLRNVRERLRLIFGESSTLAISRNDDSYLVMLTVPSTNTSAAEAEQIADNHVR